VGAAATAPTPVRLPARVPGSVRGERGASRGGRGRRGSRGKKRAREREREREEFFSPTSSMTSHHSRHRGGGAGVCGGEAGWSQAKKETRCAGASERDGSPPFFDALPCFQPSPPQLITCANAFRTSPSTFTGDLATACPAVVEAGDWPPPPSPASRGPLAPAPPLATAARAHAQAMAASNFFDHTPPGDASATPLAQVTALEPRASRVGQLIAAGWPSPVAVLTQLACTPANRRILLSCGYDGIGAGVAFPPPLKGGDDAGSAFTEGWDSYFVLDLACVRPGGCEVECKAGGGSGSGGAPAPAEPPTAASTPPPPQTQTEYEWKVVAEPKIPSASAAATAVLLATTTPPPPPQATTAASPRTTAAPLPTKPTKPVLIHTNKFVTGPRARLCVAGGVQLGSRGPLVVVGGKAAVLTLTLPAVDGTRTPRPADFEVTAGGVVTAVVPLYLAAGQGRAYAVAVRVPLGSRSSGGPAVRSFTVGLAAAAAGDVVGGGGNGSALLAPLSLSLGVGGVGVVPVTAAVMG